MERLTRWQNDIVLICKKSCDDCKQAGDTLCSAQENVYKRLAAYEDIGTVEDFQRLVTAQNEGRLVELPCKVGDTVYILRGDVKNGYETLKPTCVQPIAFNLCCLNPFTGELKKGYFITREEAAEALKGSEEK